MKILEVITELKLFNDPNLRMVDQDTYTRSLGNKTITETVFGKPTLK